MPGAVVIGLFCTYLIPFQAVTAVEGQTEEWRVRCVQLGQIWSIGSIRFGLSAVKSEWVNSQLLVLASPLLALLHLRLAYLTRVWIHLFGSIHTLLNPHTHEPIIFLHRLEVLVQVLQGAPSPSFMSCYHWTGAWPRWLQIFLQILC